VQLVQVSAGQLLQDLLAGAGQADPHHPAVAGVRRPLDQPRGLGPVYQLHRAVRAQQQVAGQVADGGRPGAPVTLDRDQQLVLHVGQARGPRLVFAPPLEAPQGDPELQQLLEVLLGELGHRHLPGLRALGPYETIGLRY
jgi:hypothetical protein